MAPADGDDGVEVCRKDSRVVKSFAEMRDDGPVKA